MQASNEFAEPYTRAERIRFVVIGTIAGVVVILAGKYWLFPAVRTFAASASCRLVLGLPGEVVLGDSLFVGLPMLVSCVVASTIGRRGLRILRDGQVPPIGDKVLRPTRIVRGRRAVVAGYLHVLAVMLVLLMVPWGLRQARDFAVLTGPAVSRCAGSPHAGNDGEGSSSSPDAGR